MPIRILHVVDHLGKGGLENGLVNLIEHLDPARFEHVVYAIRKLGPNADRLAKSRVQVLCQGKQDSDSRFQVGNLARAIRQVQPDIVHSRNWAAVEAVLAGRWVRFCKVVHSEHGLEAGVNAPEPKRRIWFRRLAYHLADRVLSVSYQLRDLHVSRTGFDPDRITVIHNGVDRTRFYPDPATRARIRQEFGIAEDQFCVGCVGNLFPVKGHLTALQGIEGLAAQDRKVAIFGLNEVYWLARAYSMLNTFPVRCGLDDSPDKPEYAQLEFPVIRPEEASAFEIQDVILAMNKVYYGQATRRLQTLGLEAHPILS